MRRSLFSVIFMGYSYCCPLMAQEGFLPDWFKRSDKAKADEPHWMTPLVTVTPRLEQEFRTDFLVQRTPVGADLVNLGNSKGLEVIPTEHLQITFGVPPYLLHDQPGVQDGFGDFSLLAKYRFLAANENHGNYILTGFLGASLPTGSHSNGAHSGIVTPTIAAGKGWGRFDIQCTLSGAIPTAHTGITGRVINFNAAFQYRVGSRVWPEAEINSTFWKGGERDGKKQVLMTAGLILGRFIVHGRVLMSLGAGWQVAVTRYHTYSHGAVVTVRFPF